MARYNKKITDRLEITFYHQEDLETRKLKIKGYGNGENLN